MTEVSSIVLRADVADIQRASSELDKFQQSAEKSAKAADSFGDSNKTASSKTDELTESVNETHRKMREFAERLRASEIASASLGAKQDKLAESLFKQIDAIKSVEGATARLNAIQAEIGQSRRKGALDEGNYATLLAETRTKLSQVEKAETVLGQVRVNFLSRLKEQVAAQRLSKDELLRYKAAQLGVSSSAEIYIKKLSESNGALNRLKTNSISMRRELGMLAAQLARGDISGLRSSSITLAGRSGLLEQLTSLRGLAIGGVFAGIAGGIFAVSKAYLEGSKESQEYNKQLILTGHYAGQTTGQLQEMARVLSGSGITQSKMAESLAKVIGSGAFYGGDIGVVAGVAARMERAIGQSIDETVKQFQRLSDEPAKAVQELDKSLHFLTATQLDNILALENQGRASEAAKIAMNAYASEMNKRTSEIAENLGWLEKAWNFVGDAATSAWDKMLGIGRERTTKDKIADIERTLIDFQLNPAKEGVYSYDTGLTAEDLRNDLKKLKEQDFLESISAAREKAERDEDERQKRRIAQNDALRKTFENAEEKHQRKINEIKNKYAYADSVIIDKAIEAENKRYKEEQEREKRKGASSGSKSYSDDAATKLLLESQKRLASLREQFSATNQLTEQEKRLAEFSQQITDLKEKRTLTADQKSVLARADEIQKSLELEASESRRLKNVQDIAKGHETALKFIQQQEASMAAMQNSAGLSNREAQRNREREQTQMMKASPEDRDLALSKLEERYKLEDELRGDWLMGAKHGWNEYLDSATNTYAAISSVAQSTLSGISNMMTDLVTTGTASFKQFSISILKMIINIINQLMVAFVVQKAMGWINASFNPQGGGEGSASFVGPVQQKWSGGYTGDGGKYEPKGVVHGGEFVFTKEATQAIGVGNLYAMMRGAQGYADGGFVGKAPMYGLNSNAGAGNTPQINVDIYIDNKGNSTSQTSASSNAAAVDKALGDRIKYEVSEGIRRALKNGGQIYNAYQR